jgi:hypothetical protein
MNKIKYGIVTGLPRYSMTYATSGPNPTVKRSAPIQFKEQ